MANLEEIDKQLKEMGVTKSDEDTPTLKDAAMFGAEFIPGVGEAMAIKRTSDALDEGDYLGAGIEATAGLMGLIPGAGDLAGKALRTATKSFRPKKTVKAYKLFTKGEDGNLYPLFVDADTPVKQGEYLEAVIPDSVFTAPNGKKYVPSKGTGKKKGTGDNIPIPDQATRDLLIEKGFLKKGSKAKSVKAVALRPGWHAGDSPAAPHIGNEYMGKKFRAEDQVWAEVEMPADVDWQSIANKRAELKKDGTPNVKTAHITDELPLGGFYRYKTNPNMQGNWLISGQMKINRVLDADEVKLLNKKAGVEDLPTLEELKAKKMAKGGAVMDDYQFAELEMEAPKKFAEGGVSKQMDMFDDGGLMQEGGTVDPVSGNDVPVGSTQEEVRDDIPAQLSEGEFVFPADVVRYWGLDTLMKMRQQAKLGLKLMEEMGQMGNSDEATIPDDMPFDINDLDMEDDGVLEYNVGGFVPQQQSGISGFQQSQFAGYQPQYQQYQPVTPQTPYTPVLPQQVPVMPQMQSIPTFTDLTGIAQPDLGGYDEMKTYVNDAGMEMQIPFKGGNPIYPIPEGYKLKGDAVETAQTTTTTGTGVETARPSDDGGDDERPGPTTGSVVSVGGEAYGPEEGGGIPGIAPGPSRRVRGATQFGLETVKEGGIGQDLPIPGIVTGLLSAATGTTVGYNYVDQKTGNKVFQTEEQHKANKEGLGKGGRPEVVTLAAEINRVATDNFKDKIEQAVSQEVTKGQGKVSKSQAREIIRNQLMEANDIDPKVGKFMSDAQIVAQGNINRVKAEASAYGINPAGKPIDQIRQEIEQEKQRVAEENARLQEQRRQSMEQARGDDNFGITRNDDGSVSYGGQTYDDVYTGGAFGGSPYGGFKDGGLVKQMEKSGLTPKK